MVYKLVAMAQRRWRRLNGAHLLPRVRAGVVFVDGMLMPRTPTRICPVIRLPARVFRFMGQGP